ncbi:MAG: 3-hydroxyacyl-ACP dehydratase FabZ [Chloroflexi bacterium]|nr:3-hydroxyacyl-ACP dehydratase FabZ [Chloroflexota bacterium]MBT7081584.1 3-hydroxyacyl-ACP dehydratase FabZ [Chloroflexota bacterium]MBT7289080.1 3-hydroxyacyl-ACP dehydratase FabZ [Chloroflexota bacterium]
MLNSKEIQEIIPHRWPFLLVDKILELEEGVRAVGLKNFTSTEFFFPGHFPDYPVVPGVILAEALAQVGAVALLSLPANKGKIAFFAGMDGFRFRKQVGPGDTVRLEVTLDKVRGSIGKGTAKAFIDDKVVANGELIFAIQKGE